MVILSFSAIVEAVECGSIPTDTCSITQDTIFAKNTYLLSRGITIESSDVTLDCNGATLVGSGSNNGITIRGDEQRFAIKNCNIQNYDYGIYLYTNFMYGHGNHLQYASITANTISNNNRGIIIYGQFQGRGYVQKINITENTIKDNLHGMHIAENVRDNLIWNNEFEDNAIGIKIVHTHSNSNTIWGNNFYSGGIDYEHTNNNFCKYSIGNNYYSGADGPTCDCYPAQNEMIVNKDTKLCNRQYSLPGGINVYSYSTLDCNGATLTGIGNRDGISVKGDEKHYSIKNCNIQSYSNGIFLYNNYMTGSGNHQEHGNIKGNTLSGNSIGLRITSETKQGYIQYINVTENIISSSNGDGIYLEGKVKSIDIWENDLFSNNGNNLNIDTTNSVSAENNWWGSNNENDIKLKIYDCLDDGSKACVDYSPWLNTGPEDRILDLTVSNDDITFENTGSEIKVTVTIQNTADDHVNNVEVEFLDVYNNEVISTLSTNIGSIEGCGSAQTSVSLNLEANHIIYVIIDPDNKIIEDDKSNNNAQKEYSGTLKYFIEGDVPPLRINTEIENYIKENIKDGVIVDSPEGADIVVSIARHNPQMIWWSGVLEEGGWGFTGGGIKFREEFCIKPFCGIVGSFIKNNKREIYIEGNDISGFVAAAKEFVRKQDAFKTKDDVIFLDERNEDALAVFDYLHTSENLPEYKEDSDEFVEIVRKALDGETYNVVDSTISVSGETYRIKNLKPIQSNTFEEYKDPDDLPVVMGGGLWSNIDAWENLGSELSDEGYDVYLIELTGGLDTECEGCTDYTYEFLTDRVYPAYINQIKSSSGKSKIKYVGHSNGARVALDSLTAGNVNPNDVDTLVLVGVPGAFSELSYFAQIVKDNGAEGIERLRNKNVNHITFSRTAHEVGKLEGEFAALLSLFKKQNKISLNLFEKFHYWISSDEDEQPGSGLNINYFSLIYGDGGSVSRNHDTIVTVQDEISIFNSIESSNKVTKKANVAHSRQLENEEVQNNIRKSLNKEIY
ncbi:MAG: alpha/beta fold hydrolase [Nanoarchaeota archaeon]|nr:alpha/beta fold hydrolase [Nanoarchaeota archaeon]